MSAGKYDQRIRLERAIRVDDGFTSAGAATWQPIATVWAEAVPVRDGEKIAAGQVIATSMYRFKVRHSSKVADLGPADRIVFKGRDSLPFDRFGTRIWRVIKESFFHEKIIGGRFWPGLMHGLVFWGFIVFGLVTLDHFAIGYDHPLMSDSTHKNYSYIVIPFSILVLIGITTLTYRRFITRPKALGEISLTSGLVAVFITVLMVTYLLGEMKLSPLEMIVH